MFKVLEFVDTGPCRRCHRSGRLLRIKVRICTLFELSLPRPSAQPSTAQAPAFLGGSIRSTPPTRNNEEATAATMWPSMSCRGYQSAITGTSRLELGRGASFFPPLQVPSAGSVFPSSQTLSFMASHLYTLGQHPASGPLAFTSPLSIASSRRPSSNELISFALSKQHLHIFFDHYRLAAPRSVRWV